MTVAGGTAPALVPDRLRLGARRGPRDTMDVTRNSPTIDAPAMIRREVSDDTATPMAA